MKCRLLLLTLFMSVSLFATPAVERLDGPAAVKHLDKVKAAKAQLFRKAEARMRERGFESTDAVMVTKTSSGVVAPAQDAYSDSTGEIVFWSWDDGDDSTWEGTIYVEDYATGAYSIWDAQIDISGSRPSTVWREYQGGVGDHRDLQPYAFNGGRRSRHVNAPQVASAGSLTGGTSIELVQVRAPRDWDAFVDCFNSGCGSVMRWCAGTGPHWANCVTTGCGAVAIYCGIRHLT
jgi:hypothetical protein